MLVATGLTESALVLTPGTAGFRDSGKATSERESIPRPTMLGYRTCPPTTDSLHREIWKAVELIQDKLTVVLAGNFNPTILSPQWVARNALGYEADRQFQVDMLTPVAGIGGMPRFSFDGISYAPNFQSVTFFLAGLDAGQRQRVVGTASRILTTLPHTPVSGVGFNFGFLVRNPEGQLLELLQTNLSMLDSFGEDATVVSRQWANTVLWKGALVSFQCQLDGGQVHIDANFHYGANSAEEAGRILARENTYRESYDVAMDAASKLSGERLENA